MSNAGLSNTSGLEPLGCAVLIEPYEPEAKNQLIHLPDEVKGRMDMINQRAIVVAVGSEAWKNESKPRAVPGDKVYVAKYAGFMTKGVLDNKAYRLVNDRDIFCRIVNEEEPRKED